MYKEAGARKIAGDCLEGLQVDHVQCRLDRLRHVDGLAAARVTLGLELLLGADRRQEEDPDAYAEDERGNANHGEENDDDCNLSIPWGWGVRMGVEGEG